jgi:hypothetical protein
VTAARRAVIRRCHQRSANASSTVAAQQSALARIRLGANVRTTPIGTDDARQ